MLSFLARHPPRTNIAHLEKFTLDAGLSTVEFRPPGHRFLVSNRLPPQPNPNPHQTDDAAPPAARSPAAVAGPGSSSLAPPPHRHPWQDETFRVVSGTARFITVARGGKGISSWIGGRQEVRERLVSADGEAIVVIPRGQVHTFRNASDETDLVVEFVLDPSSRNTDEAYFRNTWGYRNDCAKAGLQRNIFQTLLFMHRGGVVMALPGLDLLARVAGRLLNFVGGVLIGRFLLGFRDSYPEYYHGFAS